MVGIKSTVEVNRFDKYAMCVLRPNNTDSSEPELENIGENFHGNNDSIIHNDLSDARWNQILDTIEEKETVITGKLDDGTWMHW